MHRPILALIAISLPLTACAGTPAGLEPHAVASPTEHHGYLSKDQLQHLADAVAPAPVAGSPQALADVARSNELKVYENTDRWLLATSHAEVRPPYALQHFDCALGVRFAPGQNSTPHTNRIFQKLFEDAEAASTLVKRRAFRARPVGDDPQRQACQTVSEAGRNSASYPSGSASVGGAYGAAMAAIAPQQADAARAIGHEIAVSRAICGMHYPTDVRVGEALGQAVFEEAARTPQFAADLQAAQAEVAALQARGQTNPGCAAERASLDTARDLQL